MKNYVFIRIVSKFWFWLFVCKRLKMFSVQLHKKSLCKAIIAYDSFLYGKIFNILVTKGLFVISKFSLLITATTVLNYLNCSPLWLLFCSLSEPLRRIFIKSIFNSIKPTQNWFKPDNDLIVLQIMIPTRVSAIVRDHPIHSNCIITRQ